MNRLVPLKWQNHEPFSGLVMAPKAGFFLAFFPNSRPLPRPVPFEDQMISLVSGYNVKGLNSFHWPLSTGL